MTTDLKDIENINDAFKDLSKEIQLLENRFLAIGMDYQFHIGHLSGEDPFYELRDNISYRLFCAKHHVELLLRQHSIIENRFENIYKTSPDKIMADIYPSNPIFDYAEQEISGIFDSLIYHLVSIFDYIGTLTNYICGQKKQENLTWTSLVSSVRDKNNSFSKTTIVDAITKVDNDFVKKLYDHRSHLIHKKGEINRSHINFTLHDGNFKVSYISTKSLNKQFSILRKESKESKLTIKYVAFWLVKKTILDSSTVLFALKNELKNIPPDKRKQGFVIGIMDPQTKFLVSPSETYWHVDEYEKLKAAPNSGLG